MISVIVYDYIFLKLEKCTVEIKCKDNINSAEFCLFNPELIVISMQNAYLCVSRFMVRIFRQGMNNLKEISL